MPPIATKEWFEAITKAWNSDPDNAKSMAEVRESILMIIDAPPNRAELILSIQEGYIREFRSASPNDRPTATIRGKYEDFEKIGKGEADIVWQVFDGKIRFRGVLPRFTRYLDQYTKLIQTIVANTEVP